MVENELQVRGAKGMSPMKAVLDSAASAGSALTSHTSLVEQNHQELDLTAGTC